MGIAPWPVLPLTPVPQSPRAGSTRALIAALALVAIAAAACSTTQWDTSSIDHPTPTAPKEYVRDTEGVRQSLIDHLSTVGTNFNDWAPPRDQATCVADRVVQRIGVDRLLEQGLTGIEAARAW